MSKFFGDRKFYREALVLAIPISIQNLISTFVTLLDNIMVGTMGTVQMTGVSLANEYSTIVFMTMFGIVSGAGIFVAQFSGKHDNHGIKNAFRFKILVGILFAVIAILVAFLGGNLFIKWFLSDVSPNQYALTLSEGRKYMLITCFSFLPLALGQAYSSTLRETGETLLPMKAGIAALIVHLALDYLLIMGNFGAPALGVVGAALAAVFSRIVEFAIVAVYMHMHTDKYPFVVNIYKNLKIPKELTIKMLRTSAPLIANEALWSVGLSAVMQCYSKRGISVIAAINIATTISRMVQVLFMSLGNAISIMTGHSLGAGKFKEAKENAVKLIVMAVLGTMVGGLLLISISGIFPRLYNTEEEVRNLAAILIIVIGVTSPIQTFVYSTYFVVRAGGNTVITFFFDCGYVCLINLPIAFALANFTGVSVVLIYFIVQISDLGKAAIGLGLIKKGVWIKNIVKET